MYIDILLLFIVLIFAIFGFMRGFISQILSILSLIAIMLFAQPLALWLKTASDWVWFQHAPALALWGMSSLFIVLLFMITSGIIALMRKEAGLTKADRWLGFGLGVFKGVIISLLLTIGLHLLPEHTKNRFNELNADINDSVFAKMSQPVLEWKSLSTFRGLSLIKNHLKAPEVKPLRDDSGPWAHQSETDSN